MEPIKFILAGQRAESDERLTIRSPYNDEVVGETFYATEAQALEAVRKAKAAFEVTRKMPAYQRGDILRRVSQLIKDHAEEAAQIMCGECGKAIKDCRGEVNRAVHTFLVAAEEARHLEGEYLPLDLTPGNEGKFGLVKRFPLGPVLGISPFNFPLNLVAHKIAPAIAAGNPIILKPATRTPLSALKLGEWVLEAGFPPEAISVLPCQNNVAQMLAAHEDIAVLSFTGSDVVGWMLKEVARKKRVLLELGGNAAVIVHSDANIADAAVRCARGGFYYAGQSCIAVQRLYVQQDIAQPFLDEFVRRTQELKVGDPRREETDLGPVIDDAAADRIERQIKEAVDGGAQLLTGGARHGRVFEPTILLGASHQLDVFCNEIFAPIVVVEEYDTFDEALAIANDTRFGLQAGVFTRDIGRINQAFETLEVGGVIINDVSNWRIDNMPYGGVKDSGQGREGPRYSIQEMTEPRLLVIAQS